MRKKERLSKSDDEAEDPASDDSDDDACNLLSFVVAVCLSCIWSYQNPCIMALVLHDSLPCDMMPLHCHPCMFHICAVASHKPVSVNLQKLCCLTVKAAMGCVHAKLWHAQGGRHAGIMPCYARLFHDAYVWYTVPFMCAWTKCPSFAIAPLIMTFY